MASQYHLRGIINALLTVGADVTATGPAGTVTANVIPTDSQTLAQGDAGRFGLLMAPCETLGQHVFRAPTQHYKAGLALLSWLNGRQDNAMLINREDLARDRAHLLCCIELAQACGALGRSPATVERIAAFRRGESRA